MHLTLDLLALLVAVETAIGVTVGLLIWNGRRATPPPTPIPSDPPAPPILAQPAQPSPPKPARPAPFAFDEPDASDDAIEDGRPVIPTPLTLVWGQTGKPPERYAVQIDTVSRDTLVFGGETKRLDVIQIVPSHRLFHTMRLPHERLLAAHDANDMPIDNIRTWLAALPEQSGGVAT